MIDLAQVGAHAGVTGRNSLHLGVYLPGITVDKGSAIPGPNRLNPLKQLNKTKKSLRKVYEKNSYLADFTELVDFVLFSYNQHLTKCLRELFYNIQ